MRITALRLAELGKNSHGCPSLEAIRISESNQMPSFFFVSMCVRARGRERERVCNSILDIFFFSLLPRALGSPMTHVSRS